ASLFCRRRPKIAFVAAPRKGSSGINQSGVADHSRCVTWPENSDIAVRLGGVDRSRSPSRAPKSLGGSVWIPKDLDYCCPLPPEGGRQGGRTLAEGVTRGQGPLQR